MKNRFYLALVLVGLMCLAGWTGHAQLQRNRQTWEYLEVELDARVEANAPKLNRQGDQGWELVGVTSSCPSIPNANPGCRYRAYMKRPK